MLHTAKLDAERANDAKSRFLTAIGHDLLQPLHAAQLFTDALQQQVEPARLPSLGQIRGALDSTTELLTGLFDMARLEAGTLAPQLRDFPLADVLDPLASEFRARAQDKGLAFDYVPTRAWIRSDPQLRRRVLQNFLANAVRYTPRGRVLLGVSRAGQGVRVEVHDTGPGIAPDQQALIFQEFRRGDGVPGQGLGLGLAIADRFARLLQAPLSMRSGPSRGTLFALTLASAATPLDPVLPGGGGLVGTHVLLVDNEAQALAALGDLLRGWGCSVDAVADGEHALAANAVRPAGLLLLDYHLDAGDTGVALHARLRERFGARPALVLTADATDAVRREVGDAGLVLLQKPVRPLALKSVLDRLLASRSV